MKKMDEVRKELQDFLEIDSIKKVTIISDNDEDGITSAAQVKRYFEKKKIESKVIFYNHHTRMNENSKKTFFDFNGEKTVFLDLADDFVIEVLEDLGDIGDVIVLDHHSKRTLAENKSLRIIKPNEYSTIEPSQYPASKMAYDLFEGTDWLASIGIIGDSGRVTWDAFIKSSAKNNSLTLEELDKLADIVSCIISQYREKIPPLLDFLVQTNDPKELFKTDFAKLNAEFQKMLDGEINRFGKDSENYPELSLSIFRTNYQFTSKLSNLISQKYPSRTIIIVNHKDEKCNVSLRNHNASVEEIRNKEKLIDCAELAIEATKNIVGGKGGGHIPAAGASFPEESFEEFKNKVIELIKKKKKVNGLPKAK